MILDGDVGEPHDYGCIMISLLFREENVSGDQVILTPVRSPRIEGHNAYRFIFGGFIWIFLVSSHSRLFSGSTHFLQQDGTLRIPSIFAQDTPLFRGLANHLKSTGKFRDLESPE